MIESLDVNIPAGEAPDTKNSFAPVSLDDLVNRSNSIGAISLVNERLPFGADLAVTVPEPVADGTKPYKTMHWTWGSTTTKPDRTDDSVD